MLKAPWTDEQVVRLNAHQSAENIHPHPYTCGLDRMDAKHLDGEGVLVATNAGWVCPYCHYTQDWA